MPEEDPHGIGNAGKPIQRGDFIQQFSFALRGQGLVDGKGQQAEIDETPNGKDIASRDEKDGEAVGDLRGGLAVEWQRVGQTVDGDGGESEKNGEQAGSFHIPSPPENTARIVALILAS